MQRAHHHVTGKFVQCFFVKRESASNSHTSLRCGSGWECPKRLDHRLHASNCHRMKSQCSRRSTWEECSRSSSWLYRYKTPLNLKGCPQCLSPFTYTFRQSSATFVCRREISISARPFMSGLSALWKTSRSFDSGFWCFFCVDSQEWVKSRCDSRREDSF